MTGPIDSGPIDSGPNDKPSPGRRRAEASSRLQLRRPTVNEIRVLAAAGVALLLVAVLVALSWSRADDGPHTRSSSTGRCDISRLRVGVATPVTAPWFVGDPADGSGFESALVKELSRRLHVRADDVSYVGVPSGAALAGGGGFDIAISQYRRPAGIDRTDEVEFSRGYLAVPQAVISTVSGTTPHRLRDLRAARLAVVAGSDGSRVVSERIRPRQDPTTYADLAGLLDALRAGRVTTAVVDLPDAATARTVIEDVRLVGLVRAGKAAGEGRGTTFRMILPRGSAYRACIDAALDGLEADGVLAALEKQWLTGTLGARYLR